jgi:type 1 glutamine amidotransferase
MNIMLVSSGMFHPPLAARWRLWRMLRQEPTLRIARASSLEALPRRELGRYAALVLYFHHKRLSPPALSAFEAYVANGGGVLALHSVTASFKETIPFFEIIGGCFTGHGVIEPIQVQPLPESWLLEGLPPFTVRDELYIHELQTGLTVHAVAQVPGGGQQGQVVPLVWTYQYGKGRICYACPGHLTASLANPSYQEVLRRGLRWVSEPHG